MAPLALDQLFVVQKTFQSSAKANVRLQMSDKSSVPST